MRPLFAFLAFLPACFTAGAASSGAAEEAECSIAAPCARVTGYSCEAGAEDIEVNLPDGALVHSVVFVSVIPADTGEPGRDELHPHSAWYQDTSGFLAFDCPGESTEGSGRGNVLVYYYET